MTHAFLLHSRPGDGTELMTYVSFLDDYLQLPTAPNTTGASSADQSKAQLKDHRKVLKRRFTESEHPGAMFRQQSPFMRTATGVIKHASMIGGTFFLLL